MLGFNVLKLVQIALLNFLNHLKNVTGSLSILTKIVLSYNIRGVFSSLSFFNFGQKKACPTYNHFEVSI